MAETANISQVANKIANDIFKVFLGDAFPAGYESLKCVSEDWYKTEKGAQKATHPGDVVFHYTDPYSTRGSISTPT